MPQISSLGTNPLPDTSLSGDVATTFVSSSGTAQPSSHSLTIVGGGLVSTTGSGSTITISTLATVTTPGVYPYTTLVTDYFIKVDTSVARTIIPMAAPSTGRTLVIKDTVGSAAANNITITPSGKTIDGAASYVINSNYGSVNITYNGTEWSVS